MDAVGPDVHGVPVGQVTLAERLVVGLPAGQQPTNGGGRQPGCRAEECLQGRDEVAGGQPVQVQQRQHLSHLGLLRHHGGKITDRNRIRSPVAGSTRRSSTRGARTGMLPAAVVTSRRRAWPLRTTSRRPPWSRSPAWAAR